MATRTAYERYAYRIFASLYEEGWGEMAAWNEAYKRASKKFQM